jgi:hypothetical protein
VTLTLKSDLSYCRFANLNHRFPHHPFAMEFALPAVLTERSPKKIRGGPRYTDAERKILLKYKAEYKLKTTADERLQFLKGTVFKDIFMHWAKEEGAMPSEEDSRKRMDVMPSHL